MFWVLGIRKIWQWLPEAAVASAYKYFDLVPDLELLDWELAD